MHKECKQSRGGQVWDRRDDFDTRSSVCGAHQQIGKKVRGFFRLFRVLPVYETQFPETPFSPQSVKFAHKTGQTLLSLKVVNILSGYCVYNIVLSWLGVVQSGTRNTAKKSWQLGHQTEFRQKVPLVFGSLISHQFPGFIGFFGLKNPK